VLERIVYLQDSLQSAFYIFFIEIFTLWQEAAELQLGINGVLHLKLKKSRNPLGGAHPTSAFF